jgi:hypothetical protein
MEGYNGGRIYYLRAQCASECSRHSSPASIHAFRCLIPTNPSHYPADDYLSNG